MEKIDMRMKPVLVSSLILLILLGLPFVGRVTYVSSNPRSALVTSQGEETWLGGWKYRKAHNITGATGAGVGYQLKFTVHYGNGTDSGSDVYCGENCSLDFSDIRFVGSDQNSEFQYWIEELVEGDYAIFWVKVGESLESNLMMYMYYGNEHANSMSNGSKTCDFFEDFSSPLNTSKWNHTGPMPEFEGGTGSFTVPSGKTWDFLSITSSQELTNRGYRLRTRMNFNMVNDFIGRYSYFGFGYSNIGSYGINGIICIDIDDVDTHIQLHSVGDGEDDMDFYGTPGDVHTEYRSYEMLVQPLGVVSLNDGDTTVSGTLSYEIPLRPSIGIHVNGAYSADQITTTYDYFWITKWQPIEPLHDSWGNATVSPYIGDVTAPIISSPEDIELEAETDSVEINWSVTDENPYMYHIYIDGNKILEDTWESMVDIFFPIDQASLGLGSHNVTCLVLDLNLNSAVDNVSVVIVDSLAPIIDHPDDMVVEHGDRSAQLIWTINETYPDHYEVYRNGMMINSGYLTTDFVSVNLNVLAIGNYTFMIKVWDTSRNNSTDSVEVAVVDNLSTTTTEPEASTSPAQIPDLPQIEMATIVIYGFGIFILAAACMVFRSGKSPEYEYGAIYY